MGVARARRRAPERRSPQKPLNERAEAITAGQKRAMSLVQSAVLTLASPAAPASRT